MADLGEELARLAASGAVAGGSRVLPLVCPRLAVGLGAGRLVRGLAGANGPAETGERSAPVTLRLEGYRGANLRVAALAGELARHLAGDLAGAFVHGSLATDEEIPYSDLDAVAIVREDTLQSSRRLARCMLALRRASAHMYRQDPLQHHGWFVLAERELARYPEHVLPVAALATAKAMLPPAGTEDFVISPVFEAERVRGKLSRLAEAVLARLAGGAPAGNSYAVKSLLSGFMLLPTLYVQVRDGRGVAKRESFAAARGDFRPDAWAPMDEVSAIRQAWRVAVSPARARLLSRPGPLGRMLARRLAPPVPDGLASRLTPALAEGMRRLVVAMTGASR